MTKTKETNMLIELLSDSDLTNVEKNIRKIRNFCIDLRLCFQITYDGKSENLDYVAKIYKNNPNDPIISTTAINMTKCLNDLLIKLEELYTNENLRS